MAIEPKTEISSLLNRYAKDLDSTLILVKQKRDGQDVINRQMQVFESSLQTLEQQITHDYQHYETQLYIIIFVCILIFVAMIHYLNVHS